MPEIYHTKTAYRCHWLKIFHHNLETDVFQDETEAKYSLVDGKFSILSLINDDYKINDQFEFLLEYPDGQNKVGMNRWAQSNNPLDETVESGNTVPGYEKITLSWENAVNTQSQAYSFGGLWKSNRPSNTLLDGNINQVSWYFSIGIFQKYNQKYMPGHSDYNTESILWLRINDDFACSTMHNLCFSMPIVFSLMLMN